jgi:hypothetical protein
MSHWNKLARKYDLGDLVEVDPVPDKTRTGGRRVPGDPGLSRLKKDMLANRTKCRVDYKGLVLLAPYFKDKIVMDVGHAEGHILYFMWHHAKFVYGCEYRSHGGRYLNFLREQKNVEVYNRSFNHQWAFIKIVEVFWICIGDLMAEQIIRDILACNPTAKIFHFSRENDNYRPWPVELGLKIYN